MQLQCNYNAGNLPFTFRWQYTVVHKYYDTKRSLAKGANTLRLMQPTLHAGAVSSLTGLSYLSHKRFQLYSAKHHQHNAIHFSSPNSFQRSVHIAQVQPPRVLSKSTRSIEHDRGPKLQADEHAARVTTALHTPHTEHIQLLREDHSAFGQHALLQFARIWDAQNCRQYYKMCKCTVYY